MKILLVDDDAFLRDMYATKFGQAGHSVSAAGSGGVALDLLARTPFDVVLLDMVMPGMGGIELLEKINDLALPQRPLCIVLSNQSEGSDMSAAKAAGANGYIVKAERVPSEVLQEVEQIVAVAKERAASNQ